MTSKERFLAALLFSVLLVGVPLSVSAYSSYVESISTAKEAAVILSAAPAGEVFVLGFLVLPFALAATGTVLATGLLYLVLGLMSGAPPAGYMVVRENPIRSDEWAALIQAGNYKTNPAGQILLADKSGLLLATFADSGIIVSQGSSAALSFSRKLAKSVGGYVQQVASPST